MSKNSYIHMGVECHNAPEEEGAVSDNAKGNKDIQKGMHKTAGAKSKAKRAEQRMMTIVFRK